MTSEEQCEAWIEEANRRIEQKGFIPLTSHTMQLMRAAWKASRESLVIELPEMIGMNQPFTGTPISEIRAHNHFNDAITQCRKSIHAAGVKTK